MFEWISCRGNYAVYIKTVLRVAEVFIFQNLIYCTSLIEIALFNNTSPRWRTVELRSFLYKKSTQIFSNRIHFSKLNIVYFSYGKLNIVEFSYWKLCGSFHFQTFLWNLMVFKNLFSVYIELFTSNSLTVFEQWS